MSITSHMTVSDLDIRDEFASLDVRATFSQVAGILSDKETKTILVVDGKQKEVIGVISEQLFLQVCATGIDPKVALCHEHMAIGILRLLENTPATSALQIIKSESPDAVIILTEQRRFKGYLSPNDYRKLETDYETSAETEVEHDTEEEHDTDTEEDADIGLDGITNFLAQELGAGNIGPVIWQEDGAELEIHNQTLRVEIDEENMIVSIEVSCDQVPLSTMSMVFDLGNDEILDCELIAEESPTGEPMIVGRWGPVLQQTVYDILLRYINQISQNGKEKVEGFYAQKSGLNVRYFDSEKTSQQEVEIR